MKFNRVMRMVALLVTMIAAVDVAAKPAESMSLNWDSAQVEIVLQAYADLLGKTCLTDAAVPNCTITLKSLQGQSLTREEYLNAIETELAMNGIHVEPYGEKFLRVVPRQYARKSGIPIIMDEKAKLADSDRVVSVMIRFNHISVDEATQALEGFVSNYGSLMAYERINAILVTDTQMNINRMREIAQAIDIPTPVLENVFVRQIKIAKARDVKSFLETIVEDSKKLLEKSSKGRQSASNPQRPQPLSPANRLLGRKQQVPASVAKISKAMCVSDADRGFIRGNVLILADERTNKLIVKSQKMNMDFFDKVIEQLDVEVEKKEEEKCCGCSFVKLITHPASICCVFAFSFLVFAAVVFFFGRITARKN